MTEQDLINTARNLVEAFSKSDWEACKAAMTPDAAYDEAGTSRRMEGLAEIIPGWQGWKEAMPDISGTVTSAYASGNTVFMEVTWQGTHTGPLESPSGKIPATGKSVTNRAAWVGDFEGGQVKSIRHYFDMLSFMAQLGLLPE